MAQKAQSYDVSVLTLEGTSYKTVAQQATLTANHNLADGTVISSTTKKNDPVKKMATLSLDLQSALGNQAVSGLQLSALTADSVDILSEIESANFNIRNTYNRADGVGDTWAAYSFALQEITAAVTMMVPTDFATNDTLVQQALSTTLSDLEMTLAFTLNSVGVSVPLLLQSAAHVANRGEKQMVTMNFVSFGDVTLPSGTTTLLEQILNAPETSQTLALTTKAAGGVTYAGEFLPESCSFQIQRDQLVITQYQYISEGAVTATPTV